MMIPSFRFGFPHNGFFREKRLIWQQGGPNQPSNAPQFSQEDIPDNLDDLVNKMLAEPGNREAIDKAISEMIKSLKQEEVQKLNTQLRQRIDSMKAVQEMKKKGSLQRGLDQLLNDLPKDVPSFIDFALRHELFTQKEADIARQIPQSKNVKLSGNRLSKTPPRPTLSENEPAWLKRTGDLFKEQTMLKQKKMDLGKMVGEARQGSFRLRQQRVAEAQSRVRQALPTVEARLKAIEQELQTAKQEYISSKGGDAQAWARLIQENGWGAVNVGGVLSARSTSSYVEEPPAEDGSRVRKFTNGGIARVGGPGLAFGEVARNTVTGRGYTQKELEALKAHGLYHSMRGPLGDIHFETRANMQRIAGVDLGYSSPTGTDAAFQDHLNRNAARGGVNFTSGERDRNSPYGRFAYSDMPIPITRRNPETGRIENKFEQRDQFAAANPDLMGGTYGNIRSDVPTDAFASTRRIDASDRQFRPPFVPGQWANEFGSTLSPKEKREQKARAQKEIDRIIPKLVDAFDSNGKHYALLKNHKDFAKLREAYDKDAEKLSRLGSDAYGMWKKYENLVDRMMQDVAKNKPSQDDFLQQGTDELNTHPDASRAPDVPSSPQTPEPAPLPVAPETPQSPEPSVPSLAPEKNLSIPEKEMQSLQNVLDQTASDYAKQWQVYQDAEPGLVKRNERVKLFSLIAPVLKAANELKNFMVTSPDLPKDDVMIQNLDDAMQYYEEQKTELANEHVRRESEEIPAPEKKVPEASPAQSEPLPLPPSPTEAPAVPAAPAPQKVPSLLDDFFEQHEKELNSFPDAVKNESDALIEEGAKEFERSGKIPPAPATPIENMDDPRIREWRDKGRTKDYGIALLNNGNRPENIDAAKWNAFRNKALEYTKQTTEVLNDASSDASDKQEAAREELDFLGNSILDWYDTPLRGLFIGRLETVGKAAGYIPTNAIIEDLYKRKKAEIEEGKNTEAAKGFQKNLWSNVRSRFS